MSGADRPRLQQRIDELDLPDGFVTVHPWLPIEDFRATFASASLVVFPSDFEGFGLPAAEAMRLQIPVVISPDLALLEITDGHGAVMEDASPEALVRAVETARAMTPADLQAARAHAQQFTWSNFAHSTRWLLAETVAGVAAPSLTPTPAPVPVPVPALVPVPDPAEAPHRQPTPSARRRLVPSFFGGAGHPHPIRWVGAAAAATLAVSGIGAASIALVHHYQTPKAPTQQTTTTTISHSSTTSVQHGHGTPTNTVPMPPASSTTTPTAPTTQSSSNTASSSATSPSTTSLLAPVTVPTVTVPTLPTITLPTFVLPQIPCSGGKSTGTSPLPVTPCNLTVTVSVCRCG